MRTAYTLACVVVSLAASGCATMRPAGRQVAGGALDEIEERGGRVAHDVARDAAAGARDELMGAETDERVRALERALADALVDDVARMREQVAGAPLRDDVERLRAEFTARTHADLARLRDELLGPATRRQSQALAEAVGDVVGARLARMRDDLLGPASRELVRALVRDAAGVAVEEYREQLKPAVDATVAALKGQVRRLLYGGSGVCALLLSVAGVFLWQKLRIARMLAVIAMQIHDIPDQAAYDELTRRISAKAKEAGVEAALRAHLSRLSLLGTQNWHPKA